MVLLHKFKRRVEFLAALGPEGSSKVSTMALKENLDAIQTLTATLEISMWMVACVQCVRLLPLFVAVFAKFGST